MGQKVKSRISASVAPFRARIVQLALLNNGRTPCRNDLDDHSSRFFSPSRDGGPASVHLESIVVLIDFVDEYSRLIVAREHHFELKGAGLALQATISVGLQQRGDLIPFAWDDFDGAHNHKLRHD
jgi:hypothetical protein